MADPTREEMREIDLSIPCPECFAEAGVTCEMPAGKEGLIHFGRRVKALCLKRRPDLLEPPS